MSKIAIKILLHVSCQRNVLLHRTPTVQIKSNCISFKIDFKLGLFESGRDTKQFHFPKSRAVKSDLLIRSHFFLPIHLYGANFRTQFEIARDVLRGKHFHVNL